jgi:hypothetical protein
MFRRAKIAEDFMRLVAFIAAAFSVFIGVAAHAQAWDVYVNRENFFSLNLPGEPTETTIPYTTAKGTTLPARKFTATAAQGSLLAGTYSLTVVDYSKATGELGTAIEEAAERFRRMGKVTYDAVNMLDNHRSWRQTVETANQRILTEILVARNNRLYISEAATGLNTPPPAQFQASLQILDENGVRIRYAQAELAQAARPDEVVPVTPQQVALRSAELAGLITGTWRMAGGSCSTAYFRSAQRTKTSRGEEAMAGTVVNAGTTITGQLIIAGPREGQFINPTTDRAIFLFDALPGNKMSFSAIGAPALGWPDVTLDRCG